MNKPEQACIDCHYFQRDMPPERGMPAGQPMRFLVTQEQRELSRSGDFDWYKPNSNIGCHMGVWDTGVGFPGEIDEVVLKTERLGSCYFWQYTPGMQFPAAKDIQQRATEVKKALIDRRYTKIGIWIAAVGLAVTAIFSVLNYLNK